MSESSADTHERPPEEAEILQQLKQICESEPFCQSARLKGLLNYIVRETLAGNEDNLLGKNIASDFLMQNQNASIDDSSTIRVEIGRVRRRLHQYYDTGGSHDPIRIDIPKGAYVASFEYSQGQVEDEGINAKSHSSHLPRNAIAVGIVLGVALIGYFFFSKFEVTEDTATTPVVAVLPLDRIGSEYPVQDLVDGVIADIVTDLSSVRGLRIISLASSSRFDGESHDFEEIGNRLGATHLVYGSIQHEGSGFRINLHLHRVKDGSQIWAKRFDYEDRNRLRTQGEIARAVSRALSVTLTSAEKTVLGQKGVRSAKALALYRQAKELQNPPTNPALFDVATRLLSRVIDLDPDSAIGYAGMAFVLAENAWFRPPDNLQERLKKVELLAARSLRIDPYAARALIALCLVNLIRQDHDTALEHCKDAVAAKPSDDTARAYFGLIQAYTGDPQAGTESLKIALALNPLDPRTGYLNMLGQTYFHSGKYQRALDSFQQSVNEAGPVGPHIYSYLAASYAALDNNEAARRALDELANFEKTFSMEAWLRRTFRDPKEADRLMLLINKFH